MWAKLFAPQCWGSLSTVTTLLLATAVILLTTFPIQSNALEEFFHQRPDQHKSFPGWQEPGLWRPRWIMDREFYEVEGNKKSRDRLYFRMTSDRVVNVFRQKKRPFFEWFKKKTALEKAKRLFESGDEAHPDRNAELEAFKVQQQELWNADGTWTFVDESPMPTAKVKIETREGHDRERVRHETRCEWGTMDGYAAKFRRGRVYKYKGVQSGSDVPLGKYTAGSFIIRANSHRPLISKDFLAFQ